MTSPVTITQPYERSLAPAHALEPGEWTDETATGRPVIACRKCGGLTELSAEHRIEGDRVVPPVECETLTCRLIEYVTLTDYSGAVIK